jgi:hypothetical protein
LAELKSITKSTYLNEGLRVLERIKDEKYEDYKKLKNNVDIDQNSKSSINTCWQEIKKRYLDFDNNKKILYSPTIKLFDNNIILKKELMYLNYLYTEPTFRKIILELIYPKLLQNNENTSINKKEITIFLNKHLDNSPATIKKTASSSAKALVDFGLAETDGKDILINFYQPELKTVIYALYNEYSRNNSKYNNFNILNPSLDHIKEKAEFTKLLLINPNFIDSFLQSGWKAGYLSYEPRGGLNQYVLKHKDAAQFADYIVNEEA